MDPLTSGLISGGVKLLSGLFGRRKPTKSTVDYVAMANAAEKAGFNRLTALRNGGAAGFTQTTGGELTAPSFIAEALGSGLQAYDDAELRELDVQTERLQQELMRAELDQLQRSGRPVAPTRSFGFGIPQEEFTNAATVSQPVAANPTPDRFVPLAESTGGVPVRRDARTSIQVFGVDVDPVVGNSDAEDWQVRYGEPGEWMGGLINMGADIGNTVYRALPRLERRTEEEWASLLPPLRPAVRPSRVDPTSSGGTRHYGTNRQLYRTPSEAQLYFPSL